jgi:hypothetical protein
LAWVELFWVLGALVEGKVTPQEWIGTWSGVNTQGCKIITIAEPSGEIVSNYASCENSEDNGIYAVYVNSMHTNADVCDNKDHV